MKLKGKVLAFSLPPLFVTAIIVLIVVSTRISNLMEKEISDSLHATAFVYRDAIAGSVTNNYYVDENGTLWNGSFYNVSADTSMADMLLNNTGISLTIFYGDTRVVTSLKDDHGNRIVGSQAGAAAIEKVLKGGQEYFADGIMIGGKEYYGYYIPLYNNSEVNSGSLDEIVGMIFAEMETSVVKSTISTVLRDTAISVLALLILFVLIDFSLANSLAKRFTQSSTILETVATGDFTVDVDSKLLGEKDESGDIARSVNNLQIKLSKVISDIKIESQNVDINATSLDAAAEECARVIEQVEVAIADIASGATGQAEDTSAATQRVIEMGNMVEATNDSVENLISISEKIEKEGHEATTTLAKLEKVNEETKLAIEDIYNQTHTTNESALKINEAVGLITAIAEETNLLSLNASIEAARAGEQGRGFAVVASQIQKLAEQSNESAKTIELIITELIKDSEKSVKTMNEVKEIMDRQSAMVAETGSIFQEVINGIETSQESINDISKNMRKLNTSREEVVDIVSNLSAIAEENAASTEETSASVTEVSASVQQVSASSVTLKSIADELATLVEVFKISE